MSGVSVGQLDTRLARREAIAAHFFKTFRVELRKLECKLTPYRKRPPKPNEYFWVDSYTTRQRGNGPPAYTLRCYVARGTPPNLIRLTIPKRSSQGCRLRLACGSIAFSGECTVRALNVLKPAACPDHTKYGVEMWVDSLEAAGFAGPIAAKLIAAGVITR